MLARDEQGTSQGWRAYRVHREVARSRAAVFDFLGSMYLERPSAALAQCLAEEDLGHVFLLAGDNGASARAIARRCRGRDAAALHEELAVEHTRLFLGPGPGYIAPYESVYVSGEARGEAESSSTDQGVARPVRLLWRDAAVAVEREYWEAGAALVGLREPPDHIGLELQFLAFLCRTEADAWEAGDVPGARTARRRRGEFVAAHLSRWVDDFCEAVERAAEHPFHLGIAKLTRVAVHAEGEAGHQAEKGA